MSRQPKSLSKYMIWAVPFLLLLLLIRTAPHVITTIRNHFLTAPTTLVVRIPAPANHSVTETTTPPPPISVTTTTTKESGSVKGTAWNGKLSVTAYAPSGSSADPSGVLTPPFTTVNASVTAGTSWVLTGSAALSWKLECGGTLVANAPSPIVVPTSGQDCVVTISSNQTGSVQWTLHRIS